jgi:hypothetical protein
MATVAYSRGTHQCRAVTLTLIEDQSLLYLEGGWDAYHVEEDVLDDLIHQGITAPVAVVLSDESAVAFYVTAPGVIV